MMCQFYREAFALPLGTVANDTSDSDTKVKVSKERLQGTGSGKNLSFELSLK
jgi:hypothetical protein